VLPLNLTFVYPRWQIDVQNVLTYIPLVMLAIAFVWCWRCWRGWGRVPFYSLAYFVVMLLPVLGFLNIYFMRYSLVADHWQYFAIIGPIALVAAMIRQPVVAAALLLALGALTWKQCGMYSNVETLWQQTIRLNPECLIAQGNLGTTLLEEGRAAEAISHYQKALEIDPTNAEAHVNLGNALRKKGSVDEAIAQYQMALQINPSLALAHNNLGIALALHGRLDEAIMHYEKALQIQPDSAECHYSLGNVFAQQRRLDEAISHYQKALQINPNNAKAQNNLGEVLLKKGNVSEAIPHFEQALQFDPADPSIQVNMAWVLATSSEASLRNGKTAVELARQADGLTGGTNPMVLHTLAAALAEAGQFHEAVDTAQRALSLATGQSDARLAQELQIELGLYQAGSPYHLPAQTH